MFSADFISGSRDFTQHLTSGELILQQNIMIQRTANENAACLRRICKRSDQSKIERLVNNDARLILR